MNLDWKTNYWEPLGFRVGDTVKILHPDDRTTNPDEDWGDAWNENMYDTVGRFGTITRITLMDRTKIEHKFVFIPIENILKVSVQFSNTSWAYPPWMLQKA
jgi:hypothetical protein